MNYPTSSFPCFEIKKECKFQHIFCHSLLYFYKKYIYPGKLRTIIFLYGRNILRIWLQFLNCACLQSADSIAIYFSFWHLTAFHLLYMLMNWTYILNNLQNFYKKCWSDLTWLPRYIPSNIHNSTVVHVKMKL